MIICNSDPEVELDESTNDIPYICRQCCRFVDAYRYYMVPFECNKCFKKICPACYLQLLNIEQAAKLMLDPVPMIKGYFEPFAGPFIETKLEKLEEIIMQSLDN